MSAADRARTIAAAAAEGAQAADIVSPGHVFPLVARDGGVLVRAGHTEAATDISRLAGVGDAGVICEIMNLDGTMTRLPQLRNFAQREGLNIATIADLIAFRRRTERLVARVTEADVDSAHGGQFRAIVFRDQVDDVEHVALVKGDVASGEPVLVRVHAINLFDDIIGDRAYSKGAATYNAMKRIEAAGRGVIVFLRETHRTTPSEVVAVRSRAPVLSGSQIRDYGTGAQILSELGGKDMILLNESNRSIVTLEGYGLRVLSG
nr:3,4-dihydroxy-2-butanone-4-phosphate synthase [Pseudohoeflea sp. DP4N28-3]